MAETEKKLTALTIITATEQPVDLTASNQLEYGITAKYERKNYDSPTARKNFHESQFQDGKTITSSEGEILHKSHKAAKNKYGSKRSSYHQAEADHKDPLKDIHERAEKDPLKRYFLKDSDLKEVGNRKKNFQELSKHENASKKDKSELQRGIETHDIDRAAKGLYTQTETDILLTGRAVKNATVAVGALAMDAAEVAITTGKKTALITLTVSGIKNLSCIASGEKDLETAIKDVASETVSSFASGAGIRMTQEVVAGIANVCGKEQITELVAQKLPSAEIAMAVMTLRTVEQYLDGNLSAEECVIQIISNGAGTYAYQLGLLIGGPAGAIVTSIVVTQIANAIAKYQQMKKIAAAREAEINNVLREAMSEIASQRTALKEFFEAEKKQWDDSIDQGFALFLSSALEQNSDGITNGLNMILGLFGKQVLFPTTESFVQTINSPEPIIM